MKSHENKRGLSDSPLAFLGNTHYRWAFMEFFKYKSESGGSRKPKEITIS
jgi:hypothetical protein